MSEERFVEFFRLVEACAHPGCPVCRCAGLENDPELIHRVGAG